MIQLELSRYHFKIILIDSKMSQYNISVVGFEPQRILQRNLEGQTYSYSKNGNTVYQFDYPKWPSSPIFKAEQIHNIAYGPIIQGIQTFTLSYFNLK